MKKIVLLFMAISFALLGQAQQSDPNTAKQLVVKNSKEIGISADQINNYKVSSTYYNDVSNSQMVYLQQTYKGLPVYNQIWVLAFKNEKVVSNAGGFIPDMEKMTNNQGSSPSLNAVQAVNAAFIATNLTAPSSLRVIDIQENGRKLDFGKLNNVTENVTAELLWVPVEKGNQKSVKLVWQIQVAPLGKADWWYVQIDAATGSLVNKVNLTVYEGHHQTSDDHISLLRPKENKSKTTITTNKPDIGLKFLTLPPTVTSADYRVYALPLESPKYGPSSIVHNPWELSGAGNNATTNGWHFNGTTNFNITQGNNVFAYLDRAASNASNATTNWPDTSTTPIPSLTFTQVHNPATSPYPLNNKKAALNNLFYLNNMMHDVYYQYGFTEASHNFQADNLGRGGTGNDYVQAEAQDGSGTDNANFSTPAEGTRPRMQMFIWSPEQGKTFVDVHTPATIAGQYTAIESVFSETNKLADIGPVTGQVVYFNDAGGTHEACAGASTSSVSGKIALINRGNCNFTVKVLAAQAAGAIGVIVVNNVAGAIIPMGGGPDNTITVPAIMVSNIDGALIAAQVAGGVTATLHGGPNIDGEVDNGIVCHEFGHGISTRLTGGGSVSCVGNAESGSEGWSDFVAYMITTNWATAQVGDGATPRPMGLYALGNSNLFAASAPGTGVRHYRYCTDMAINPVTYASIGAGVISTEIHDVGEVWAEILWEMTWALVQQDGINPNIFNGTATGGNSVAMKLVLEGMKLQPCSPGFVDARNAILTADQNIYGGAHLCTLWAAFAKRGLGYSASQGSSGSASDQTAAFNLPPIPAFSTQPSDISACLGSNVTFTSLATGYQLKYNWQVSTDGGITWNNVNPAVTTATLTLTAVTASMSGYKYRVVASGGCPNTLVNSTAVTLTVTAGTPNITSQPANVSTCAGTNATFNITVAGTNAYNWQVSTDGGLTWASVSPANTTTTLTITGVTAAMNGYQYRNVVTGGCPIAAFNSNPATLTIATGGVAITTDPVSASACPGGSASFSVTATGTGLTYNWQVSTDGGLTWSSLIPPVNTATLNLTGVTAAMNNNQYRCGVNGSGACTATGINSNAATLTVSGAVAITSQPANASVCTGNNATFTVTASGAGITYSWQVSTDGGLTWTDVTPAVNTATLTITGVTAAQNNNQYRAVIGGTCAAGTINSSAATLTINTPASVTSQPANTSACIGGNANFTVTASGSGLSYNWQVSTDGGITWTDVTPASNTSTLTLTGVTAAMNNNQYRSVVSISCNPTGVNSNGATLTVNSAPSITSQPTAAAICEGANTQFCVTASGTGLTYQWQVNTGGCSGAVWTDIAAANTSCLPLNAVTAAMNNNAYRCVVSGTCTPSVTTDCITLTVNTAAAITGQPASVTGCTGGNASFTVTAAGSGLTYSWQVSTDGGITWTDVTPSVNTATLTLSGVTALMNNNQYRAVVGGTCSATTINSNAATLTLATTVSFTTQPVNAGVCAGTDATFTVAAVGTGLSYNWQVSTDGGVTWNNVSPSNNTNTLTIFAPTTSMSGYQYRNVASGNCNPAGVNSSVVTLTVNTSVTLTSQPTDVMGCTGSAAVFSVTATGSSITYQWQVSVNGGAFVDLLNSAPYSGVNTNTLTINPATGLNGNQYHLNASGAPCGGIITSNNALLDVKPLPEVVLTAASYSGITPSIRTTLYATVSPPGTYTYQWYKDGILVPSITTDRFSVQVDDLGKYQVTATNIATNCSSNKSNTEEIDFAVSSELFVYPNPSSGQFQVRYLSYTSGVNRTLNIYDSKGSKVYTKEYPTAGPYTKMDVNMDNAGSDVYLIELRDDKGKRLATGKVVIK